MKSGVIQKIAKEIENALDDTHFTIFMRQCNLKIINTSIGNRVFMKNNPNDILFISINLHLRFF